MYTLLGFQLINMYWMEVTVPTQMYPINARSVLWKLLGFQTNNGYKKNNYANFVFSHNIPVDGSKFHLQLCEWSFTLCLYNFKCIIT